MQFKALSTLLIGLLTNLTMIANPIANGAIVLKNPNNQIMKITGQLALPSRKDGKLYLHIEGHEPLQANKILHKVRNGRSIYYMAFNLRRHSFFRSTQNMRLVLKGSYLKGNNGSLFFGDAFIKSRSRKNRKKKKIRYLGGFYFRKVAGKSI